MQTRTYYRIDRYQQYQIRHERRIWFFWWLVKAKRVYSEYQAIKVLKEWKDELGYKKL